MNLGIVLSTQPSSFSAMLYEGEMVENIAKIKDLGYDGIELASCNPERIDGPWLKFILHKVNLKEKRE